MTRKDDKVNYRALVVWGKPYWCCDSWCWVLRWYGKNVNHNEFFTSGADGDDDDRNVNDKALVHQHLVSPESGMPVVLYDLYDICTCIYL